MKLIINGKPSTLVAAEDDVKVLAWRLAKQEALAERARRNRQAEQGCLTRASRLQG